MAKFLHLADVHLGFDRYDNPERTKDFFRALQDVVQRYAVEDAVDFVLIAGDLFEHRTIQPATLNQAQLCLQTLQQAGIEVLAIEGNHDNRPYGTRTSWLKYLSEWGLLKLLEPGNTAMGEAFFSPWNETTRRGGYIDLDCGVRVLGSHWYGATAPQAIERIASELEALPPSPGATILMFHHGLEGQIARYAGALRYSDLLPLKAAGVDYLALGHIHKNYEIEGWVFNPGSLEANNVDEARYARGVYQVEVNGSQLQATLKTEYFQRPVVRLRLTARGQESEEDLVAAAVETVEKAIATGDCVPSQQPLVELQINGQIGFDRLELDTRQLQTDLQQRSKALIFLLKFDVEDVAYATPVGDSQHRREIEQTIFMDFLTAHRDYKKQAEHLALGLMELKDRQIEGEPDPDLYNWVQTLLDGNQSSDRSSDSTDSTSEAHLKNVPEK